MLNATRVLKIRDADRELDVQVRVLMPEEEDNKYWTCKYEIAWPTETNRGFAAGIDAIQALLLALQIIGIRIYTSSYHEAGNLMWDIPGQGYGFPVSKNLRDLLIGGDVDL